MSQDKQCNTAPSPAQGSEGESGAGRGEDETEEAVSHAGRGIRLPRSSQGEGGER